ncbi:MAG: DUF6428 family protein [Pseudomonadota bacterium]
MNTSDVTLNTLRNAAHEHPSHTVVFATPDSVIPAGFHLTEFKRNRVDSIDCGGVQNQWLEVAVELLGDTTGAAMQTDTLSRIIDTTEQALPGIASLPLYIEYAPHDATVQRFQIASLRATDNQLEVALKATHGECKANTRAVLSGGSCCSTSCCT